MGRTKELTEQYDTNLEYQKMIIDFNLKLYDDFITRDVGSSED